MVCNFENFLNCFVLNRTYNINNNTIWLTPTDSQLYDNQISDTLSEGSLGVSNKKFIEGEGIKYKYPIKLDKKINGYEHKCSDISSCNVSVLDKIKTKNINRSIISNLNINSLPSKFDKLKVLIQGKIDILIITETKLESNFSLEQFAISGYSNIIDLTEIEVGEVLLYILERTYPVRN